MELSAVEQRVLVTALEAEAHAYRSHLAHLAVRRRDFSGAGFYTHLAYKAKPDFGVAEQRTLGKSLIGRFRDLNPAEAGFLVYIDTGMLTMIEAFSHSLSDWPRRIEAYELVELRYG